MGALGGLPLWSHVFVLLVAELDHLVPREAATAPCETCVGLVGAALYLSKTGSRISLANLYTRSVIHYGG